MKVVLPNLIYYSQNAFVGGNNPLHSVITANKVVEEAKYKRKQCLVLKVDYKKANDCVN